MAELITEVKDIDCTRTQMTQLMWTFDPNALATRRKWKRFSS